MKLDRLGRNFEKLHGLDVPQMTFEYYVRLFYYDMPREKIEKVLSLNMPHYNLGRQALFHKFSAVVAGKCGVLVYPKVKACTYII